MHFERVVKASRGVKLHLHLANDKEHAVLGQHERVLNTEAA